ncbi:MULTISPECIES: GTP-binding protein [unclassified Halomonas]|uniref:CobW family GTP-binding protein n=1 Tax=unclassified Halomonas TaxID=2609666 RepID=UPI000C95E076|nr:MULTISPECIES: GTP-binding protein [unclassified Halomonas]MAR72315.1 GTP-binding protein [Halomonas sp.]|tara:strand:- start:3088 stop:4149 length:1062 start_codon:yes stop_codon:yes gene_type:complete
MQPLASIPTHVITGFLGSGKSQLIRHWIDRKPVGERWAILINEFGQVGIDQAIVGERDDVTVQGVPGGCLCCQVATVFRSVLVQLLRRERPDRLLIEPSGLGHPAGLLEVLGGGDLAQVLDLRQVITVLDARRLDDPRVTNHSTFVDQLAVAEGWVLSMQDLLEDEHRQGVERWRQESGLAPSWMVESGAKGLPIRHLLDSPARGRQNARRDAQSLLLRRPSLHAEAFDSPPSTSEAPAPIAGGAARQNGHGLGYRSASWHWHREECFDLAALEQWWKQLPSGVRVKGVMRTGRGWRTFPLPSVPGNEAQASWRKDSRLEMIWPEDMELDIDGLEQALERCRRRPSGEEGPDA